MLKKFFISMLGTMAGLWISLLIVFVGGLLIVGAIAGDTDSTKVEKHSILYLHLTGTIAERYQPASFAEIIQNATNDAPSLDEMIASLRLAATDSKIEAVWLDCSGAAMGMASREELLEAIRSFKQQSGKPVYAYADNYAQGDFILASAADSVFLNPMGAVDIHGLGAMTPFFKNTLDKLGVKMQIIKVGSFKSAVEPFILTQMSDSARLQTRQYVDSLWSFSAEAIAAGRDLATDSIYTWAPEIMFTMPSQTFVERNLVDALAYRRGFEDKLRAITDRDSDEDLRTVAPVDYLANADIMAALNNAKPHIAVYYAVGDIVDTGDEGIVGANVVPDIIELADNDNVRALVLRVNSGGGSAFASEQIWEALQYFKSKGKPFYVSMGDYAASGGYYISCGADKIYADATTLTGSIGVFGMIPDFSGLVTDKLGVTFSVVETNPNGAGIDVLTSMTPEQHNAMQRSVEDIYERFTGRVAEGRSMDINAVKRIAEGRVWVGSKAVELGLVDEIGSLRSVIDDIAAASSLDSKSVVAYPSQEEEMWLRVLRQSGGFTSTEAAAAAIDIDPEAVRCMNFVRSLRTMNPIQARMETVVFK